MTLPVLGRVAAAVGRRLASSLGLALGLAFVLPAGAAAHSLNATYESRLPLAVYLVGAAVTVALSFVFVIVRDVRAAPPDLDAPSSLPPAWLRFGLRAVGLIGWAWIIAQGLAGGSSDGDVATLFLWVYGWVGIAIVSALIGPIWHFLDPFSTCTTWGPGSCDGCASRAGHPPSCRRRSAAGRRSSASRPSCGSSS